MVWAIADNILSGGYWDAVDGYCGYNQNVITGIGYYVADMLCDIFCTVLNLSYWGTVSLDLVKENSESAFST
ncbi:hypothetical protein HDU84_005754 [Entophlyctis sp. JEL0112]|nr:hypothetical protein HDU84_005754 [Entophlyctis sp. JEL0112]